MTKTKALKLAGIMMPALLSLSIGAPALALSLGEQANTTLDLKTSQMQINTSGNVSASGNMTENGAAILNSLGLKMDQKVMAGIKGQNMEQIKARADAEITRRVVSLTELNTRLQAMTHIDAATKATLSSSLASEIATMNNLKATIDASTDLATIKIDAQSISQAYRVYMLVIPQARVLAASDRVSTVADMMTALSVKLQTRISEAGTAGANVTSMTASLSDMNAKIADAKVQAAASASVVANLTPDNGDNAKMQANEAALRQARASLARANADLKAAHADEKSIIAGLKGKGVL